MSWLARFRPWADRDEAKHRGQPAALSPHDLRRGGCPLVLPPPDGAMRRGRPVPDVNLGGAGRTQFVGGYLPLNPIGAGVFYRNQLPIHQDGRFDPNTAQYFSDFGSYVPGLGVVWGMAPVNFGNQPRMQPIYTPEQLATLIGGPASGALVEPITNIPIF